MVIIGRPDQLGKAGVCRGVGHVALVMTWAGVKVIRAAKVIFRPCGHNGRLDVIIQIELYFAFTPPQVIIRSPGHVRTYIMPPTFNTIQDYVNLFVRQWVDSAKLSMEVGKIL